MKPAFNFEIARVVGTPTDGFWSQVHTFSPEESEKKRRRGDLLAVIVISGVAEGVAAVAAGREVLGRIHEEYYGNLEGTPFERLQATVEKIGRETAELEIVAAVLFGGVLYLALWGQGKVYLKRGDKLGLILEGSERLQTGSGILQEDDILVLGSSHFFKVVGRGVFKASLESHSPREAVETLAPIVLGHKKMATAAAIVALVKAKEEMEIAPVTGVGRDFPRPEAIVDRKPKRSLINLKILSRISGIGLSRRPIFVRDRASERKRKIYFLIALILLGLLPASLGLGVKKHVAEKRAARAGELLKQAEEKLNQGKTIALSRPKEGRVLGEQARSLLGEALSVKQDEKGVLIGEQIEHFLASLGQEIVLTEPKTFMDLGLIADGALGDAFCLSGKDLVILDGQKKKVYLLDIKNKSYQILDFSDKASKLATSREKAFLLGDKGVYEIQKTRQKIVLVIEKEERWQEIFDIGSYFGHIYLPDRKSKAVWRYLSGENGFGPGKNWFIGDSPDFEKSRSMAIDGAIWILEKKGIVKFNLGKKENFTLSNLPEEFLEPVKIFTNEETTNLYVLDRGRAKVYVFDKNGSFKTAYFWEGLKQATDLVVRESAKKIFVLSGSKIYGVELK